MIAANLTAGVVVLAVLEHALAADILLMFLAVALWVLVVLYGTFRHRHSPEGKAMLGIAACFALLSTYSVLDYWLPGDLPNFDLARGVLYLVCLLAVVNFSVLLSLEGW